MVANIALEYLFHERRTVHQRKGAALAFLLLVDDGESRFRDCGTPNAARTVDSPAPEAPVITKQLSVNCLDFTLHFRPECELGLGPYGSNEEGTYWARPFSGKGGEAGTDHCVSWRHG